MGPKTETRYLDKTNHREHRHSKRKQDRRCRDIRRRIGGCVFMLGIPLILSGGIILIVSNTNQNKESLPPSLFILGPVLTCLAVLCFITGALLTEMIDVSPLLNRLIPDNPDTCPLLFKVFKGNNQSYIDQQAAIISLQQAPQKSALRKPPNPEVLPEPKARRGVTFSSGSDSTLIPDSSTSDQSNHRLDNDKFSSQSSVVSLRSCKIFPKESDVNTNPKVFTETVYTVSPKYFDIPVSTKYDDDVFYQAENVA